MLADAFADRPFERPLGSETFRIANASKSAFAFIDAPLAHQ
jgi:hypothetical protein